MNYRQKKKRLRIKALSDISKLNCTKDDVIMIKFPYTEMDYKELVNWIRMLNKYIKHNTLIALPGILTLKKCSDEEIEKWIKIANDMLKNK